MFHIHKWGKWELWRTRTPYGESKTNIRTCEKCGLKQRKSL